MLREKSEALAVPQDINQAWSMDLMHDQLEGGRTLRLLNVVYDSSGETLAIETGLSSPPERVICELEQSSFGGASLRDSVR